MLFEKFEFKINFEFIIIKLGFNIGAHKNKTNY